MNLFSGFPGERHLPQVIDARQPELLERWCRFFGVGQSELASVVSAVGGNPDVVKRHLYYANRNSNSAQTRSVRGSAAPCVSTAA